MNKANVTPPSRSRSIFSKDYDPYASTNFLLNDLRTELQHRQTKRRFFLYISGILAAVAAATVAMVFYLQLSLPATFKLTTFPAPITLTTQTDVIVEQRLSDLGQSISTGDKLVTARKTNAFANEDELTARLGALHRQIDLARQALSEQETRLTGVSALHEDFGAQIATVFEQQAERVSREDAIAQRLEDISEISSELSSRGMTSQVSMMESEIEALDARAGILDEQVSLSSQIASRLQDGLEFRSEIHGIRMQVLQTRDRIEGLTEEVRQLAQDSTVTLRSPRDAVVRFVPEPDALVTGGRPLAIIIPERASPMLEAALDHTKVDHIAVGATASITFREDGRARILPTQVTDIRHDPETGMYRVLLAAPDEIAARFGAGSLNLNDSFTGHVQMSGGIGSWLNL
ncbi:HlyD family efflux transporter periplasmic adaptor subunit [Tateyamaria omphalii]|uniref:HlyD family efflux transporter periplasmic adaptor subunit n=1 Tax=Tateyamaria omphalii TaxID=299262 RepID=UPI001C9A0287|nr:HlyD family efflux transporter periplasmic adaptor subunit [Tateyamaria omphalii]MBY5935067.1 HlyD family efflux transporter periplasmic adaptor subunit [Tateyamaria omphalii]